MRNDPRAIGLLAHFADALILPRVLAVGIGEGESGNDLDRVRDDGRAAGLIQISLAAHGHDAAYWTGIDGAGRSLQEMTASWQAACSRAPSPYEWARMSLVDQVFAFARFWPDAQGCDPVEAAAAAPRVLPAALAQLAAWEASQHTEAPPMAYIPPKPPIHWYPAYAGNYTAGRPPGVRYEGIVLHTTAGGASIEALANWFKDPAAMAATTYGVDAAAQIGQFVSLNNTASAHGIVNRPSARIVLDNIAAGEGNPNHYLIGIEHVDGGVPGTITDAQFEKSAQLAAWLFATEILPYAADTGASVSRERIITHAEIDSVNRSHCPSWPEERIARYIARVRAILAGPVVAPPPVTTPAPFDAAGAFEQLAAAADDIATRARAMAEGARRAANG